MSGTLYFPTFIWKFWLSQTGPNDLPRDYRVHVYDVYDNDLYEVSHPPPQACTVFQDLRDRCIALALVDAAEHAFSLLERETEGILSLLMEKTYGSGIPTRKTSFHFHKQSLATLRKYLAFLRFRNSKRYQDIIHSLTQQEDPRNKTYSVFLPAINEHRARALLRMILSFLEYSPSEPRSPQRGTLTPTSAIAGIRFDDFRTAIDYCWRLYDAEICVGIASENQEFILSDTCFGALSEGFTEDPECCDIFFPIFPTFAVYILGSLKIEDPDSTEHMETSFANVDVGVEFAVDVHLRNAMILQTLPRRLYFSGLRSVSLSIASYDEFRWIQEHQDYSRLKQRCRQKFLQETVTPTLAVRSSVILTDLTNAVALVGSCAVSHGAFSDVWKAVWMDPIEKRSRGVAVKVLRQVVVKNVREKLMKRIQAEVVAWHRLCHRNINQLYGIIHFQDSIGMVSPWCEHGTICHYLKGNVTADRLSLLIQIASGIEYLHSATPVVVHGDLKGANILIDEKGCPVITDFGLARVFEDVSESLNIGSSFFAGSTRWMAPEVILALVEDDDARPPPISTHSDVYAFASVCFEVATDNVPYPHRTNDHAVIADILRGIKPMRGSACFVKLKDEDMFWIVLDRCWDSECCARPSMQELVRLLEKMKS